MSGRENIPNADARRGKSFASRLYPLLSSVESFCRVMTDTRASNIGDVYGSSRPEIAALIWGSMKLTMIILLNFVSYYNATSNLLMKLGNLCPLIEEYRVLYPDSSRLQRSLSTFNASLISCCKHLVDVMQHTGCARFAKRMVTSFDAEFKPDIDEIQRNHNSIKEEFVLAKAQADQRHQEFLRREAHKASRSRSVITRLTMDTKRTLNQLGSGEKHRSQLESWKRRQALVDSLSDHDYMSPLRKAIRKRYAGTMSWIFETQEYRGFLEQKRGSVLWCTGKIGSGKTIAMASIIQNILLTRESCTVSFFFVESDNIDSLKPDVILRSILHQRLKGKEISATVEARIRELNSVSVPSDIVGLLVKQYACIKEDRKELLQKLSTLISSAGNIRLFLASRRSLDKEVIKYLGDMETLTLDCQWLHRDISAYITGAVNEALEEEELIVADPCLVDDIKMKLIDGAQGMFLWAFFQLRDICSQHSDEDIRYVLDHLPKDLEEIFERALRRIEQRHNAIAAQKIFPWVAVAKRPLQLDELREAIHIEIGQECTQPERLYNDMGRIGLWCEDLVEVCEETGSVQFTHSTIRRFLVEGGNKPGLGSFRIDTNEADHAIGEICVTYLNFNDFKTTIAVRQKPVSISLSKIHHTIATPGSTTAALLSRLNPERKTKLFDLRTVAENHPFLRYASEGKSKTWLLWRSLATETHHVAKAPWWTWAIKNCHPAMIRFLRRTSNHTRLVDVFLDDPSMPLIGPDALLAASIHGHVAVVKMLLTAGVDVNVPGSTKYDIFPGSVGFMDMTALEGAAANGCLNIIKILLAANANVDGVTPPGHTPLIRVALDGHGEAFELRRAAKEDITAARMQQSGHTPLVHAALCGHLEAVELLLAAKADVNATSLMRAGLTPLQAATESSSMDIIRVLLAAGANNDLVPIN
ncbi:hypothetical protein B0I35DRAFT_455335 [Stachybotrys elegans]|uniref:NACHT domain-containing protein n=1 Tax=Stachybotrys elegans TaxID=80388 RepID=A0A8K0SAH0_9HYPO|nr:hypothetical protein B0I35DRAFT_455335 [Stachybotrys elegans]